MVLLPDSLRLAGHVACVVACVAVVVACVCRIDRMRSRQYSYAWFLVYALFSAYAFGLAARWWRGGPGGWGEVVAVAGMLLHLFVTGRRMALGTTAVSKTGGPS